jgi:ketosteroid isomerase-like protein
MSLAADHVVDVEEIRALTHRYALAVDRFDPDGVMDVYADDAVLDLSALAMPRLEGRDALRAFFEGSLGGMAHQSHVITNHVIVFDGADAAHGTHYVVANAHLKDGQRMLVHGLHEDAYTRTPSGWKIASRTLTMLVPPALEEAPEG